MKRNLFQNPGYPKIFICLLFLLLPLGFGGKEGVWSGIAGIAFLIILFLLRDMISLNLTAFPFAIFVLLSTFWSESPDLTLKWGFYFAMIIFMSSLSKDSPNIIKPAFFIVSISIIVHYARGGSPYLTTLGRAEGAFFHPNAGAGFLLPASVLSIYPKIDIPLLIFSLTGILLTGSRTAFFLFFLSVITTALFRLRSRKIWLLLLFTFFILFIFFLFLRLPPISKRISLEVLSSSLNVRLSLWKDTINAISQNPIIGYGYGSFERIFPYFQRGGVYSRFPHSFILEILFSSGIIGIFLFVFYLYKSFDPSEKWRLSFIPLFLHSLFDFSLSAPATMGLFLTIISGRGFKKYGFQKVILSFTSFFLFLFILSGIFLSISKNRKDLESSIKWGEVGYAIFPLSSQGATMLSNLYLEKYRKTYEKTFLEKAKEFAERAIALEEKNYAHYMNMGTVYLYLNDRKSALSSFKKSIALYPQYPKVYIYAGRLAYNERMVSEAMRIVEKGLSLEKILISANNNEVIDIMELYALKIYLLKGFGRNEEIEEVIKSSLSLGEIINSKGLIERKTSTGRRVWEVIEEIKGFKK